jgi:hypothetical protein
MVQDADLRLEITGTVPGPIIASPHFIRRNYPTVATFHKIAESEPQFHVGKTVK